MPTESELEAFDKELSKCSTGADVLVAMRARWRTPAETDAWINWSMKKENRKLKVALDFVGETNPISRDDLIRMLATMNYNRLENRGKLVSVMQKSVVPWIAIGNDRNGEVYRILPGVSGLRPDQPKPLTDRELISENVLGVNFNIQPRCPTRRREANLSEESTKSNDSTDADTGGFVFHQIGTLQSWDGEPEELRSYKDAGEGEWHDTGFCVVMRFGLSGAANGVYILYDFYPKDALGHRGSKVKGDSWGRLWGSNKQFSLAKIADRITDLKIGRTFDLTEVVEHPVEIVRAVKTSANTIIRVTVAR